MTLRETEGEEESWKKQEAWRRRGRRAFFFFSHTTFNLSPRPANKKQDQLSALLDGHFTAPSNKKDKNKNVKK